MNKSAEIPLRVFDVYQNIHILAGELGGGGQGVVYRTRDPDIAVKLVTEAAADPTTLKKIITDAANIEKLSKCFETVRLLPIPEGLPLAMPVAQLQKYAGYVMRLLDEMEPFGVFGFTYQHFDIKDADIPAWMVKAKLPPDTAKQLLYYKNTGALRRRLEALSQAAAILARLHARGLVYCDVSHNNIFVSSISDTDSDNQTVVWFIDADNLRYEGRQCPVTTPEYGVPEVMQGFMQELDVASSCAADCYAFAILAFRTLTMLHPFLGAAVIEEEENNENDDENPQMKAYSGLFPFIDDPDDDSNYAAGPPRELFLNSRLVSLFEQMFCAGRQEPTARPPALIWAEALAAAADQTLVCPNCGMSYYYTEEVCPYCDVKKPPVFIAKAYRLGNDDGVAATPCWIFTRELTTRSIALPRRLFSGFTASDNNAVELEWYAEADAIYVLKKTDTTILDFSYSDSPDGHYRPLAAQNKMNYKTLYLHARSLGLSSSRYIVCAIGEVI
jgi:serine/threonine protein kinase